MEIKVNTGQYVVYGDIYKIKQECGTGSFVSGSVTEEVGSCTGTERGE